MSCRNGSERQAGTEHVRPTTGGLVVRQGPSSRTQRPITPYYGYLSEATGAIPVASAEFLNVRVAVRGVRGTKELPTLPDAVKRSPT